MANTLTELETVRIDPGLPVPERVRQYLGQLPDPCAFSCEGIPVRLAFAENGEPLAALLERHFSALQSGL